MKPQPHLNFDTHLDAHRTPNRLRTQADAGLRTSHARKPAPAAQPRYPSLSDDHMPPLFSVRLIAALAIIAIFVALIVVA